MTAKKVRAPRGYRIVKRGKVRVGDLIYSFMGWGYWSPVKHIGKPVSLLCGVARPASRAKRRK